MPTYRTPDVYVEEISVFPPSVAEVETAIPAFVGYTQRANELTQNDLINKPKRIKSLLEFESYYGVGPTLAISAVLVDDSYNFLSSSIANHWKFHPDRRTGVVLIFHFRFRQRRAIVQTPVHRLQSAIRISLFEKC